MTITAQKSILDLSDVPETMLWPLWNRAAEQKRPQRLLDDPLAAELVDQIDYDFRGMFGPPSVFHVIRARLCDDLIADYVDSCDGDPIVVSLGDGIDTQAWRVAIPEIQWFHVDVPEAIAVRERLLPKKPRSHTIACSALDPIWLDGIPRNSTPFVSAAGLLMYLEENDVVRLLAMIADWFPGATVFFDTIPPGFSRKTLSGFKVTNEYTAPPMPWGIAVDDIADFLERIPGIAAHRVWTYGEPYPQRTRLFAWLSRISFLRNLAGGLVLAKAYRKVANGYYG